MPRTMDDPFALARRRPLDGLDPLTRLADGSTVVGHLDRTIALARRDSRAVGVLAISVDVPAGGAPVSLDEVMSEVGRRVIASTRTSDLAARLADDELLIVLTAMANAHDAAIVAVRLLLQLSQPYMLGGRERSATVAIGVSSFPTNGDETDAVVSAARTAMAAARSAGGGYRLAGA